MAAIYLLRLDGYAGLMVDDAWYIVLGKALATAKGYRLISSATTPMVPAVPPGFPALLSLVFRLRPRFPAIWCGSRRCRSSRWPGSVCACWIDFTRHRDVPERAGTLLGRNSRPDAGVGVSGDIHGDGRMRVRVAQAAAVILVERIVRRDAADRRAPVFAGLAAAAATLLRALGLLSLPLLLCICSGIVGGGRRQSSPSSSLACVAPWQLYARAHAPSEEERAAHGGTIVYSYAAAPHDGAIERSAIRIGALGGDGGGGS